jgi:hypothetical protein
MIRHATPMNTSMRDAVFTINPYDAITVTNRPTIRKAHAAIETKAFCPLLSYVAESNHKKMVLAN